MHALAVIFSLLAGAAGWFYLFYARADAGLSSFEGERSNRWRARLRRAGGLTMLLLAALFYVAFRLTPTTLDQVPGESAAAAWLGVLLLLGAVLVLGLADVILTHRLRRELRKRHSV
jgi:hypothetical protein